MAKVHLRRLGAQDSLLELTTLIRRAYLPLGLLGVNCTRLNQTVSTTRRRIAGADCFVAVSEGRLVGTVTLGRPDPDSECLWYRHSDVASIHQLAVDPAFRAKGSDAGCSRMWK